MDERRDRVITGIVTAFPVLSLFFVGWQLWASLLGWKVIRDAMADDNGGRGGSGSGEAHTQSASRDRSPPM